MVDKRTIIIGDVHGCIDELCQLCERVAFGPEDKLVFVGYSLPRGPILVG